MDDDVFDYAVRPTPENPETVPNVIIRTANDDDHSSEPEEFLDAESGYESDDPLTTMATLAHSIVNCHKFTIPTSYRMELNKRIAAIRGVSTYISTETDTWTWTLSKDVILQIFNALTTPSIDLFATNLNKSCNTYCGRNFLGGTDPQQLCEDAFDISWDSPLCYFANPPYIEEIYNRIVEKNLP